MANSIQVSPASRGSAVPACIHALSIRVIDWARWSMRRVGTRALALGLMALSLAAGDVNAVPRLDEQSKAAWSEVFNQYQRRADLVPNLVETVKGYARQEQTMLTAVIAARSKATQMRLPDDILAGPGIS